MNCRSIGRALATQAPRICACATAAFGILACGSDQVIGSTDLSPGKPDPTLVVQFEEQSVDVDLRTIETSNYKGLNLVGLVRAWERAKFEADINTLVFEFVGSEGFRPSSKDCDNLPGTQLNGGYIDPISRKLVWDESLGLRGCYSVSDTTHMIGHTSP